MIYQQCNYFILLLLYDFEFENVEIKQTWKLETLSVFESACVGRLCQDGWTRITYTHWRKSRGMGGCIPPPHFFGGGMACTNIPPPLFEDKITLNLTFIVKKLTFLTVKLLKTQKIARSHTNVFWDSIFAVLPVSWHHLCKERCRIKQTLV